MNFLDNTIAFFAPGAALKRVAARVKMDSLRRYEAAASGRRTDGWKATAGSANTETRSSLSLLRARSRDLVRNNPYAKTAIQRIASNTIGTGIQPQPLSSAKARVTKIKQLWRDWAETTACDFDGLQNLYGLQHLVMRAVAESGEALVLRRRVPGKAIPIQLQVIEGDYIDSMKDYQTFGDGGWITQGVEFDKEGRRVAYWLYKRHPIEFGAFSSERVPAADVLHVYRIDRPGQVRGVPFGTSAMLRLKDFDDYEDAEVVRQKIAACFAGFVTDADPMNPTGTKPEDMIDRLEPGIIQELAPGKTMTFASPPLTQNYDTFSKKILQAIAVGFGVTYEALTGDLSNVNFSSGRMGWLEFQRAISDWQEHMIIPMFCSPVWAWFVGAAEIGAGFKPGDLTVSWTPPRREMIDPVKETKGLSNMVRNGFNSWSETVRGQGYDPQQVAQEIADDMAMFDKLGLKLDCDPRNDNPDVLPDEADPKADEND